MEVLASSKTNNGDFDLRGYEVVYTQFLTSASLTSVSFSRNGIRFSSACIRKFIRTEYIELQIHPHNQQIAVLPCSEQDKHKLCWARHYADSISVRTISGSAFLKTLYILFNWDIDKRYRLRGEMIRDGNGSIVLFDARMPEIFTSRYETIMPWATGFGDDYYSYRTSRFPDTQILRDYLDFNADPGLRPTTQEIANKNARLLVDKFQNDGGTLCDSTDILN